MEEEETDYLCNILVVGRKDWIVSRIENLSDEKTTSDAEPSDLVRAASVSVGASLCIVGTNTTILILVETNTMIILILGTNTTIIIFVGPYTVILILVGVTITQALSSSWVLTQPSLSSWALLTHSSSSLPPSCYYRHNHPCHQPQPNSTPSEGCSKYW